MSDHTHAEYVEGCYRCDTSRDEVQSMTLSDIPDPFPDVSDPWNEIVRLREQLQYRDDVIAMLRAELAAKGRTAPEWSGQTHYSPTTETKDMQ